MKHFKNAIIGLIAAAVISILYMVGALVMLEERLYDFFLRFRANRERIDNVVFLDIDDQAIAYYGIFPWPRSIPADGLMRLKEYGARAAIFDIEYIDRGPQGVDSLYLDYGLGNDFHQSFSEISSATRDILSAIQTGRIRNNDISHYAAELSAIISSEHENLFGKAQAVARDNDVYLAQAKALFGRTWSSLNLRENPLEDEQAERYLIAQDKFAYQINASPNANRGAGFADILPALPMFAEAALGAGFTNVEIDEDGVRRRVYLAQNIKDHWYLQLAFAPLINYLGSPEIDLEKSRLTIKQAKMPNGVVKDISIPLDYKGRMMLDWPKEDYDQSYVHISFASFSLLDTIEAELEKFCRLLDDVDYYDLARFDSDFLSVPGMLRNISEYFDDAHKYRTYAMENTSDEAFEEFLYCRDSAHELIFDLISMDLISRTREIANRAVFEFPQLADFYDGEAGYIAQLIEYLIINLERHEYLSRENYQKLHDKFVILGRVDTGTTDYGANPFHGIYINVGTHGVVLDTILSESFIIPLKVIWSILFTLIFIPIFFIFTAKLSPIARASVGFGTTLLILIVSILVFRFFGVFMGVLGILVAMIGAIIVREIISYAGSEKEKQFIRTAFSTYVSSDVVKEIISDPSRLQLGGTDRRMTALFTDIKGFSTISEQLTPEELVNLLNKYLSAMSDVVLAEKGTIDKYIGDAIVAFFGAPLDLPDHALRACISAIRMMKVESELNKIIMEQKLSPIPLFTRFGINTGNMVAGNMGTANKMNYTIMGNAVNLSARLEGVNKQYGTCILASEDTIRETGDALLYRKLDRVRVVGITLPVRICELIDTADAASEEDKKRVKVFNEALAYFEFRSWNYAIDGFKETLAIKPDDEPAKLYLDRIEKFLVTPPTEKWDGVYNLTSK